MALLPVEPGGLAVVQVATVGPGLPILTTQPARTRWRLLGARVHFVADGNVANRRISLQIMQGVVVMAEFGCATAITAGQTRDLQMVMGLGASVLMGATVLGFPGPNGFMFNNSSIVQFAVSNVQVADQLTLFVLQVEEWIESLA